MRSAASPSPLAAPEQGAARAAIPIIGVSILVRFVAKVLGKAAYVAEHDGHDADDQADAHRGEPRHALRQPAAGIEKSARRYEQHDDHDLAGQVIAPRRPDGPEERDAKGS